MSDASRIDDRHLPDWLAERACVDELPAALSGDRRDALAGPELAVRRAEIERSNAEILAALPPAGVAAEVARRARVAAVRDASSRRTSRMAALSAVAVACAIVIAVVVVPRDPPSPTEPDEITRVKGVARLVLHRKRGDRVDQLQRGTASARSGDLIQLAYVAGNAKHGAVLSIDGTGVVTLHFPDSSSGSTQLVAASEPVALGHSYELDDAPGFERFFFITSSRPIDVAGLVRAAEDLGARASHARAGSLSLSPDHTEWSIVVRKEAP